MIAKELFEKLGYTQKIFDKESNPYDHGLQYIKKDNESEKQRIGMIHTKTIEFYFGYKEILMREIVEHRDGTTSERNAIILSLDEINALQKQVEELHWS